MQEKLLLWKVESCNLKIASVRIRCMLPALSLERHGWLPVMLEKNETVSNFDNVKAMIFVKSFSYHDYLLAKKAHASNIPIILDLCDNIFVAEYASYKKNHFSQMAAIATKIVTTTSTLADVIASEGIRTAISVIPDQIESNSNIIGLNDSLHLWRQRRFQLIKSVAFELVRTYYAKLTRPKNYLHLLKLIQRKINWIFRVFIYQLSKLKFIFNKPASDPINTYKKTVIWFGNHGAPYSNFGLTSLAAIREDIEQLNKVIPIRLLVVSNSQQKFNKLISGFNLYTEYRPWTISGIFDDLKSADVCILPIMKDPFSLCKSPNRALLALSLNIPVVASSIGSMNDLSECIILDDFYNGVLTYLSDPSRVEKDLKLAQNELLRQYSDDAVCQSWLTVVRDVT